MVEEGLDLWKGWGMVDWVDSVLYVYGIVLINNWCFVWWMGLW